MHRRATAAALVVAALIISLAALVAHANRPARYAYRGTRTEERVPRFTIHDSWIEKRRSDVGPPDTTPALVAIAQAGRALGAYVAALPTTTTTQPPRPPVTSPPITSAPESHLVVGDYHSWPDWPLWQRIGRCEQPGPGADGIYWNPPAGHSGGPGSTYPGGLGIYSGAWSDYHAEAGVAQTNGAYASPSEQIAVARVILAHAGGNAWGCY